MANAVLFPVVGIGASSGGLESLTHFFQHLSVDTGMAFGVIVHLTPSHKTLLPELLGGVTTMPVLEAQDGVVLEPNHVYVIAPNTALTVRDGRLNAGARPGTRPMPIDAFFHSIADAYGALSVGIVLSGQGSDGALGLGSIKDAEGTTFCQDPQSAKYDGMPRSAIDSGYADRVLTPEEIARALSRFGGHGLPQALPKPPETEELREVFRLLRKRAGLDLKRYRRGTVQRRIARRMYLMRTRTLSSYLPYLMHDSDEQQRLVHDILIGFTRFFRDPEVFVSLQSHISTYLRQNKSPLPALRVWVPGCACGEEAYSIAICAFQAAESSGRPIRIKVFGSDLNDTAIKKARQGRYLENIAADISPERLARYFEQTDAGYRVSKEVRDRCVFSRHDLTEDPPFHQMDLVSCRNLLSYLNPNQYKRALHTFHFALEPGGLLLLGKSEGLGSGSDLFAKLDQPNRLFVRRPLPFGNSAPLPITQRKSGTAGASRLQLEEMLQEQQAAHEETIAVNEELQSLNEELETTKEQLQAANEEMTAVNEQLRARGSEIEAARALFAATVNTLNEPLLILDADLRIHAANESAYRCFQTNPADTLNQHLGAWCPELWKSATARTMIEDILPSETAVRELEISGDFARMGHRDLILNASRIQSSDRILVAIEDVTQKRKHEDLVRQAQKKQAIGQLAGGVAHDFNNLLMGILGNVSLLADEYEAGAPQRAFTDPIIGQVQRASLLTQQLIAYSGQGRFQLSRLDLSRSVMESCNLSGSSIPANVDFSLDLAKDLPPVFADAMQIHQVISNLIMNAVEAIGDRPGSLLIRTGTRIVEWGQQLVAQGQLEPGTYASIEVHDTGCGIEEQFQSRIFDPFFTTKFTGRGLGLAAVLGIVQNHKGAVRVESVVGKGTTFSLFFPPVMEIDDVFFSRQHSFDMRSSGLVLIVDGEPATLERNRLTLEHSGYNVLTASHAEEAIEKLTRSSAAVSVVILDVCAPDVSLPDDLVRIRTYRPDLPIILSSGLVRSAAENEVSGETQGFLLKPYEPTLLIAMVDRALTRQPPSAIK